MRDNIITVISFATPRADGRFNGNYTIEYLNKNKESITITRPVYGIFATEEAAVNGADLNAELHIRWGNYS